MNQIKYIGRLLLVIVTMLSTSFFVMAQRRDITGTVKDESGEPVVGASIVIKGTTRGTTADIDGNYRISVPDDAKTLVISFIGMETKEVSIDGNVVNATLGEGQGLMIDEVVKIGYGTARKRDLTGSVSSIKGETLSQIPVTTAAEALTGKVAGVQITTSEGVPGADIKIRVRGGGSITQDNEPLYIIDGFPSDEGLTAVDPTDIESIDVLKDASSTAIYGARGANGVIIITTRSGKEGKTSVNFDSYFGIKKLARKMDVMTPYEFTMWQYNIRTIKDDGRMSGFENMYGEYNDLYYSYTPTPGVDWQDELFGKTAFTQTYSLSVTGGSKTTRFNVGYTYNDEDGILINTGYKRHVARVKLDHKAFNDRVAISINANYSDRDILGGGAYGSTKRLADAILYRPTMGPNYTDEQLLFMDQDETEPGKKITNLFNPIKTQEREYRNKRNTTIVMNASVDWEIIKNLNFRVMGGFSNDFSKNDQANLSGSKSAVLGTDGGIWGKITSGESRKWNNTNTLTYKLDIGDTHSMNFMIGNEQISTTSKSVMAVNNYFPDYGNVLENLSLGTSPGIPTSSQSTVRLMSFFARGFYSLMDKYLITATIRTDGSTKFYDDNRWGVFPSISAAWRLSEESFIKGLGFLNAVNLQTLKLRANYGESGNNRIDNDQYETVYTSGHYGIGNSQETAMYPKSYANKSLKWETTVSRGVGLDWGIFKGRLAGTIDWYMNDTRDLLIKQKVSSITGFSEQFQNIGSTRNTGMEFTLNIVPIAAKKKDDFQWNVDFNISFNKNKVKSLGGDMNEFYHTTGLISSEATDYVVRVGSPVGSMYGYVTDGYYQVSDFEFDAAAAQQKGNENNAWVLKDGSGVPNTELYNVVPGALKLKDLNNDGKIDADDRTIIGNANPTHFGGLNNTFTWKGFDLSIFINWVYGNDVYNVNKLRFTNSYSSDQNALSMMNESWRVFDNSGNDIRYNPSMLEEINRGVKYWRPFDKLNINHSWAIEDGSFLRINNITLGYTLPDELTKKLRIQRLRFYITLNNLYVFTKYTGYDPEVDTNSSPLAPNADYSAYPRSKGYIFGLNFTF